MELGVRELSRILGCTSALVTRYKRNGMPMTSEADAREWIAANIRPDPRSPFGFGRQAPDDPGVAGDLEDYQTVRTRRERAEADLAELKLAEQRERLVDRSVVEAEQSRRVVQFREGLLQIAARLSPLLADETDQGKIERLIDAEHRQALQAWANG